MNLENNILKIVLIITIFIIYHQYRSSNYPNMLNRDNSENIVKNYIKDLETKIQKLNKKDDYNNNLIFKQIKDLEKRESSNNNLILKEIRDMEHNDKLENKKILSRINNLKSPTVIYTKDYNNPPLRKIRINYPTRGYPDPYQQVGILGRKDGKLLNLFGRQKWPGSNLWEYYAIGKDSTTLKTRIPIKVRGDKELEDDTVIDLPLFNLGKFRVKLYDLDGPRYIPYI